MTWNEIDGSKLDVMTSSIQMARDIFAIRVAYMLGAWKVAPDMQPVLVADGKRSVAAAPAAKPTPASRGHASPSAAGSH